MREDRSSVDVAPDDGPGFAAWVRDHLSVLSALATREVGAADAEDVVQEALIRAWQRRSTYSADRGSARGWLVAIVLDQARRFRSRRRTVVLVEEPVAAPPSDAMLDLDRAIDALPKRQREVVVLRYLADLPTREVAAVLHISEGTVKSMLSDARSALQTALTPDPAEEDR